MILPFHACAAPLIFGTVTTPMVLRRNGRLGQRRITACIGLAGAVFLAGWIQAEAVECEVIQWGCLGQIRNTVDMMLPQGLTNMVSVAARHLHNLALKCNGRVVEFRDTGAAGSTTRQGRLQELPR